MAAEWATVHVVDDDEAVRESLEWLLQAEGYRTAGFASGRALLDGLGPDTAGCVIADVRMPDMTGLDLQDRLAERAPGLPVVIMTGHGDVPMAVRAMKAGAVDFIEKPFTEAAMLAAVARALAAARPAPVAAPATETPSCLAGLTQREHQVLELVVRGRANKVIAHELSISPRTVEIHRARVMEKTGADSLAHLIRLALAAGLSVESD